MRSSIISTTTDAISSGGTVTGDLTISGDLTVTGDSSGAYSEIVTDGLQITKDTDGEFVSLILVNESDAASTAGIISQRFDLEDTGGTAVDSGKILVGKESSFTATASTQDSYMAFQTSLNGTLSEAMRINSDGKLIVSNSNGEIKALFENTSTSDSQYAYVDIESNAGNSTGQAILRLITPDGTSKISGLGSATQVTLKDGNVGIGTSSPSGALTVQSGSISLVVGADVNATTLTNDTRKYTRFGMPHYHNAEEPITFITGDSDGTDNIVALGGMSTTTNAATQLRFYTAANDATTTGTERIRVTSAGNVGIGATPNSFHGDYTYLQIGATGSVFSNTASAAGKSMFIGQNVQYDADGSWDTIVTDESSLYEQNAGIHYFYSAASHASVSTLVNVMKLDINSRISLSNNDSGDNNTIFGYGAGANVSSGVDNSVFIGHQAADAMDGTEQSNVAIGYASMGAVDEGASGEANANIAIGANTLTGGALSGSEAVAYNVAIGDGALNSTGTSAQSGTIAIGADAGTAINHNHASGSVLIGHLAGTAITEGRRSVAVGFQALNENTVGDSNIAIGYQAAFDTLGGLQNDNNIAIGSSNPDGTLAAMGGTWVTAASINNVAIGTGSMSGAMNAANYNVAMGTNALGAITTGDGNTGLGNSACSLTTTGSSNVAIGGYDGVTNAPMRGNVSASQCVAIGTGAMAGVSTQDGTVAIGYRALTSLTSGSKNTAMGYYALSALTGGCNNIAIGYEAMDAANAEEASNIAIGYGSMGAVDETVNNGAGVHSADHNISIGENSLTGGALGGGDVSDSTDRRLNYNIAIGSNTLNSTGQNASIGQIAIGYNALTALTTGAGNVAVGYQSGDAIDTQSGCTLIGYNTGTTINHDDAVGTTAVGWSACENITSGQQNTAMGYSALKANGTGDGNTAVGFNALLTCNVNESYHTAIGANALKLLDNNGSNSNTAVGYNAGTAVTTGHSNTILGAGAGDALQAGVENVIIGKDAEANATDGGNCIVIGATAVGQDNNSVTLGNADVTKLYAASDGDAVVYCGGINMSLNQPAPDAGSSVGETLDGYEEGTFTPAFSATGGSGNVVWSGGSVNGYYTKIGNVVYFTLWINTTAIDSGDTTNALSITGLPFTSKNATNAYGSISMNYMYGFDTNVGAGDFLEWRIEANVARLDPIINNDDAATGPGVTAAAADSTNCRLIIGGHYFLP